MSEWWTYELSDFLLFSPRTYYRLLELYNAAIWPAQCAAAALGAVLLVLLLWRAPWRGRAIAAILVASWLWVTWFYLLQHYDTINWAAGYFAYGFAVEVVLLLWTGAIRDRLRPQPPSAVAGAAGCGLVVYAVAIYPLVGPLLLARPWAQAEMFGVAPEPTVIATLGVLVAAVGAHWLLLAIPLLWCAIGGATLWTMGSADWPVLPVAGAIAVAFAIRKSLARTTEKSLA
jgi:hypothetical protein